MGWRWAEELAKQNKVTVLTHAYFRESISAYQAAATSDRLDFVYYEILGIKIHPEFLNSRIYYFLWQIGAWWKARELVRHEHFDLVHHLTWGTFRFPSFMGFLGVPFVYGPLGGADRAPLRLRRSMPRREALFELIRDVNLVLSFLDPIVWLSLRSADLILAKTEENKQFINFFAPAKVILAEEIGCGDLLAPIVVDTDEGVKSVRLFYAGRLIGLKGVHFAIRALAKVNAGGVDAVLYIAGDGPMLEYLKNLAKVLGVFDQVVFLGKMPRDELLKKYADMDLFVFPSLHDSSGNVVLEALASSLPVICLDLGGPKCFVDSTCGRVINTKDKSEDEVTIAMANEIVDISRNRSLHEKLKEGAHEKALGLSWEKQIGKAYMLIQSTLLKKDRNE